MPNLTYEMLPSKYIPQLTNLSREGLLFLHVYCAVSLNCIEDMETDVLGSLTRMLALRVCSSSILVFTRNVSALTCTNSVQQSANQLSELAQTLTQRLVRARA